MVPGAVKNAASVPFSRFFSRVVTFQSYRILKGHFRVQCQEMVQECAKEKQIKSKTDPGISNASSNELDSYVQAKRLEFCIFLHINIQLVLAVITT